MAGGDQDSSRRRGDDRDDTHRRSHRDAREDDRKLSSSHSSHRHRSSYRDDNRKDESSSRRQRSRSPDPRDHPDRSSDDDGEHELHPTLVKHGVAQLSQDDYFIRATEFKAWLSETKGKYLDEISSKDARRYFDRFVRRWNDGRLSEDYYAGRIRASTAAAGSSSQTRHRWTFTSKSTYSSKEQEQLAMIRDNVDTLTNGDSRGAREARDAERRARKEGGRSDAQDGDDAPPTRDSGWNASSRSSSKPQPSTSSSSIGTSNNNRSFAENRYDREHRQDLERIAASEIRRRQRQDQIEEQEETAFPGGRATGRDRMIEKKRERAANHREFANRRNADDGIEMDDRDLYDPDPQPLVGRRGDSSSFPTTSRSNDAAGKMSKKEQIRQERMEERKAEMQEKVTALKEKDRKTMEMFQAMARERFGG